MSRDFFLVRGGHVVGVKEGTAIDCVHDLVALIGFYHVLYVYLVNLFQLGDLQFLQIIDAKAVHCAGFRSQDIPQETRHFLTIDLQQDGAYRDLLIGQVFQIEL